MNEFLNIIKDNEFRDHFRQLMRKVKFENDLKKQHGYQVKGMKRPDIDLSKQFLVTEIKSHVFISYRQVPVHANFNRQHATAPSYKQET